MGKKVRYLVQVEHQDPIISYALTRQGMGIRDVFTYAYSVGQAERFAKIRHRGWKPVRTTKV